MSALGSRGSFAIQYFAPDGTELLEPFYQSFSHDASSSYHPGCAEAGEWWANQIYTLADLGETASDALALSAAATAGIRVLTGGLYRELFIQAPIAVGGGGALVGRMLARNIVAPLASTLREGLCESLQDPNILPPIEVGLTSPDLESSLVEVRLVCDEIGSEYVGSSGRVDGNGDVTVTGHTEPVCTDWHHEIVS